MKEKNIQILQINKLKIDRKEERKYLKLYKNNISITLCSIYIVVPSITY